jgi:ADP-heptose:LPS heptosyltransferase
MQKILVLRGGALGDFIVTLPALALLRRRWPAARIELAGNATAAVLALDAGLLDTAHSQHESRWSALYSSAPLPADFAVWLRQFDLVANFWPDPTGELRAHFPVRAGQIFLQGDAQPRLAPAAASYCAPLQPLGVEPAEFFCALRAENLADAKRPHRIALHPGSGSPRKNWPRARWTALCESLGRDHRIELLIVTGEAEDAETRALSRFGTTAHALPLRELTAQLARCALFLGHDSGVSHLAAACGVPSILLFGPTDPAMWAPPAPHVTVLRRGDTLDAISVEDVLQAVAVFDVRRGELRRS